jgi:hypothetical protein
MIKTIDEYRSRDAINYSLLSALNDDPRKAKLMLDGISKMPTLGQIEGSVLDTLCFDRGNFYEQFVVMTKDAPKDKLLDIANECIKVGSLDPEFVLSCARRFGYQPKWKDETIKTKVPDLITEYVNTYLSAGDKTVISETTYKTFAYACEVLQTHPFTSKYFKERKTDKLEVKFQVPIYWREDVGEFKNVEYKGLIDILIINHSGKWIRVVDLKKNSKGDGENAIYNWKYYLQGAMYTRGVQECGNYKGYTVQMPVYIFCNTQDFSRPKLYSIHSDTLLAATQGGYYLSNNEYKKGYHELTRELLWHQENNKWDYSMEEYLNDGVKSTNKLTITNPYKE